MFKTILSFLKSNPWAAGGIAVAALAAIAAVIGFLWHYDHLVREAEKVPGLERTIENERGRVAAANLRIEEIERAREAAELRNVEFETRLDETTDRLMQEARRADANDLACVPTDAERMQWNVQIGGAVAAGHP